MIYNTFTFTYLKKNTALIFIICLLFMSCENEIPFDINNNQPKLVLNALIDCNAEDNIIGLSLTGRENVSGDLDATVNIYVNGILKEQLTTPTTDQSPYFDKMKTFKTYIKLISGNSVKIEAITKDGKYHAWAEDVVPETVEIQQIDTTVNMNNTSWTINEYINAYVRIKTTFTDDPLEKNFYRITVSLKDSIWGKFSSEGKDSFQIATTVQYLNNREDIVLNEGRLPIEGDDNNILFRTSNVLNVFDDSRLSGPYTLTVSSPVMGIFYPGNPFIEGIGKEMTVSLYTLTEAQFFYFKALNLHRSGDYSDLPMQPVSLPSNVHGGIGIVGFSNSSKKTFRLPDYIRDIND